MTLAAGNYSPTVAGNGGWAPDAISAICFQYMRVGNVVTVSGMVLMDTAAAGNASFYITLPVSSDIISSCQVAGTAATRLVPEGGYNHVISGRVYGDATNDRALVDFYNTGNLTSLGMSVHFTYLVS